MNARPHKRPDGISTRCDITFMSKAELAIRHAMQEVEEAGGSPALTDAVILLGKAQDRVADHMEGMTFSEEHCPGHIASDHDRKVCGRCGTHIDSLRPPPNKVC